MYFLTPPVWVLNFWQTLLICRGMSKGHWEFVLQASFLLNKLNVHFWKPLYMCNVYRTSKSWWKSLLMMIQSQTVHNGLVLTLVPQSGTRVITTLFIHEWLYLSPLYTRSCRDETWRLALNPSPLNPKGRSVSTVQNSSAFHIYNGLWLWC